MCDKSKHHDALIKVQPQRHPRKLIRRQTYAVVNGQAYTRRMKSCRYERRGMSLCCRPPTTVDMFGVDHSTTAGGNSLVDPCRKPLFKSLNIVLPVPNPRSGWALVPWACCLLPWAKFAANAPMLLRVPRHARRPRQSCHSCHSRHRRRDVLSIDSGPRLRLPSAFRRSHVTKTWAIEFLRHVARTGE